MLVLRDKYHGKKGSVTQMLLLLFSHSVVSDSLPPHGLQHARLLLSSTMFQSLLKFMSIE